jgi:hypothetical protein
MRISVAGQRLRARRVREEVTIYLQQKRAEEAFTAFLRRLLGQLGEGSGSRQ